MDDSSHLKQPKLELNTPDDVENMHAIREFITNRKSEQEGVQAMLKYEGQLLDSRLKSALCVADLDRLKAEELEQEVQRLKEEKAQNTVKIKLLQDNNNTLRAQLQRYENLEENNKHWVERQSQLNRERLAALKTGQQTMRKLADLIEKPISKRNHRPAGPAISRLCMRFDAVAEANENIEEEKEGTADDGDTTTTESGPTTSSAIRFAGRK